MSQQIGMGGEAQGSPKEYITGLILSILLTLVPFAFVSYSDLSPSLVMTIIILCAVAQLLVQGIFFLHLNGHSSQIWNITSAIFVIFILLFVVIGSIWIFGHLAHNMLMGH